MTRAAYFSRQSARFSSLHQATWALLCGTRAHYDDRRTLEVPGCSSALCLGFYCCRGRARPVSSGCVRLSITPSSRRRRAPTTGSLQLKHQQSGTSAVQPETVDHLPLLLGQRRACQWWVYPHKKKNKKKHDNDEIRTHAILLGFNP